VDGTPQYGSTSLRSKFEKLKLKRAHHDKSSKHSGQEMVDDVPRYYSDGSEIPTELAKLASLPKIEVIVKEGERDAAKEVIAGKKKENVERRSRIIKGVARTVPLKTEEDQKSIPVAGNSDDRTTDTGRNNFDVSQIEHSLDLAHNAAEDSIPGGASEDSIPGGASVGSVERKSRFVEQHRKQLLHASMYDEE